MADENVEEPFLDGDMSVKDDSLENSAVNGDIDDNEDALSDGGDPGEQHEFEIIDQVESEEEAMDGSEIEDGKGSNKKSGQGNQGDGDDSSDTDDFDDSELHALLEKGIDKDSITNSQGNEDPTDGGPIIRHKIVLRELDSDPFDILPEGWVCATHNCGMPVYLHKESRVCTMAKPYYLGAASTRKHDIPISAIPCLQYRNQLKKLENGQKGQVSDLKASEADETEKAKDIIASGLDISNGLEPSTPQVTQDQTNDVLQQQQDQQKASPPSSSERSSKHKPQMWVVTQESSSKTSPVCNGIEAIHTGKEGYKDGADSAQSAKSNTSVHTSCSYDHNIPKSPGLENIAVTYESSTLLNSEDGVNGVNNSENKAVNTHHSTPVLPIEETNLKVPHGHVSNGYNSDSSKNIVESEFTQIVQLCPQSCPVDDSQLKNGSFVSEEASIDTEPSQIVTSSTSNVPQLKRKIEDLLNKRGGKLRKLGGGSALPSPDNNIAVNTTNIEEENIANAYNLSTTEEQLKAHTAEVKIKTAEERAKESVLDIGTVHKYCSQLFQFKTIVVKKYRTWRERRKHLGERNRINRPELPSATKLITCPIIGSNKPNGSLGVGKKKEFVLNPSGKSFLCILHEYMQRTLKIQPTYVFKELENSKTPYGATVMINNIEYGTGYASSKKMAKQEAAKETLKILIPDLSNKISDQELKHSISDLSFFDDIKVEDPRVYELGNKVGQPSPFQLLRECLRRNFGMGNTQCDVNTTALKNQKCEFTIKVGKHTATVVAKNKRDGKQLAAQAILAKLHPHVPSWGSLLRLYATNVEKPMEKIEEMNEIKTHIPNKAVLESLRDEMRKLHQQKEAIQSKGKMVISSRNLPIKMSGVDL